MNIITTLNKHPFNPAFLLANLKKHPKLNEAFTTRIRHYVLERHTFLVMTEYEKYFSFRNTPVGIDKSSFRLMLALHDVGKSEAHNKKQKSLQYYYTLKMIEEIKPILPLSKETLKLVTSIISFDPIGLYFQDKISLENSITQIKAKHKETNLELKHFFNILMIYYQVDIASYTKDAGGIPFLEHLFEYEGNKKKFEKSYGLLKFASREEKKFIILQKKLL